MRIARGRLPAVFVALVALGACRPDVRQPQAVVYVLIDLSQTWNNERTADRNNEEVAEIGRGISDFAASSEPPIEVQYRAIGADSLRRDPLCDGIYDPRPVRVAEKQSQYLIASLDDLKSFLLTDCPIKVFKGGSEPLTEISAAILAAGSSEESEKGRKYLIIASDFKEETAAPPPTIGDMSGVHVLLAYRAVDDDRVDPDGLARRIQTWSQRLTAQHALVQAVPDDTVKESRVAAFLFGE